MKVFVYFNLHTHLWSIKALEGENKGRVVAHAEAVELYDCELKVYEAGRQRVLKEQRKNVHAGVIGELIAAKIKTTRYQGAIDAYDGEVPPADSLDGFVPATYNPYKYSTFVIRSDESPVNIAEDVILDKGLSVRIGPIA